jgi:hypothetical protein
MFAIDTYRLVLGVVECAQIVKTRNVVSMFVCEQHCVDMFDICCEHLLSEIGAAINDKRAPFGFDQNR